MKEKTVLQSRRTDYFDDLRVLATIAVIFLHISAVNWLAYDVASLNWQIINFYDSMVRWSVPIFVMISGALFLSRDHSLEKIYKKNILRIVTAFVFWSAVYAVIEGYVYGYGLKDLIITIIRGHYHMWFLYMIVGIYMLIPFIREISKSDQLTKYFLSLALLFTVIWPQFKDIVQGEYVRLGAVMGEAWAKMDFHFTAGYIGYFLAGYYLNKLELNKKKRVLIYVLGILGFVITFGMTAYMSVKNQAPTDYYYGYLRFNVLLESVAIFVFGKYNLDTIVSKLNLKKLVHTLSKYSFGAYLVHALIIRQLSFTVLNNGLLTNPLLFIPLITIIVAIISFLISVCLNHIPVINKYIV